MPRIVLLVVALWAAGANALERVFPEVEERSSPVLSDSKGQLLARGTERSQLEGDGVRLSTHYSFTDGRQVTEISTYRQQPELIQDGWSWEERAPGGELLRRFEVNFQTGQATAFKQEKGKPRRWSERVEIEPGKTFAGTGFVPAIRQLQPRLAEGEVVELKAVGMAPRPRVVKVEIRRKGTEPIRMGGRSDLAEHIVLHPELGPLVGLIANVPDFHFWFTRDQPPQLLRSKFTMVEPGDPLVTADTHPQQPRARAAPPVGR